MRRVALRIAYRGKDFSGSQYQPGLRTVVGDMITDLQTICHDKDAEWFDIKPSSRTDAGVDALGNVVAVNTDFRDNLQFLKALNAVSERIFYTGIADVSDDFNPRFANERVYRYILPSDGLDVDLARLFSELFLGEHDFIRFCKQNEDKPTVTTMDSIDVEEKDGCIVLTFRAQYYLWNMIRKISAAIDSVARGYHTMDDVKAALGGKVINFGIARPDALTLMEVRYEGLMFLPYDESYSERRKDALFSNLLENTFLKSL